MKRLVDDPVIFCLVPRGTSVRLMADLRKHYARADPRVKVIEERRKSREEAPIAPPSAQRERTQTERRRRVVPRVLPALPPEIASELDDIFWVQHLVPVGEAMEQLGDAQLFDAIRAKHREAPAELYWRWYARMHSRLEVLFGGDVAAADRHTAAAFGGALDALEDPDNAGVAEEKLIYAAVDACRGNEDRDDHGDEGERGIAILDPALDEPLMIRDAEPMWAGRAISARDELLRALGRHVVAIEHVGSTAVENLPARPIIDLLIGVEQMPPDPLLEQILHDNFFENCGDAGVSGRLFFRKRGYQRVELHVVKHRGSLWEDTLRLRDHLRHVPGAAHHWSRAKLAAEFEAQGSTMRYAERRRATLEELLAAARGEEPAAAAA
jgi:GrpB-like predicted nucleotidyltransferase (UPF0157 family)